MNFFRKKFDILSTPALVRQVAIKRTITAELKKAIHAVQQQYIGKANEPIIEGSSVENLCSCIEAIFINFLKNKFIHASSTSMSTRNEPIPDPEFWQLIITITHKDVINQILQFNNIDTVTGKCRAWVRMAVNDTLLCSYITTLVKERKCLDYHYHNYSYLKDPEQPQIAKNLFEGLNNFIFRLNCNESNLNNWDIETLSLAGIWHGSSNLEPLMPAMDVLLFFKEESNSSQKLAAKTSSKSEAPKQDGKGDESQDVQETVVASEGREDALTPPLEREPTSSNQIDSSNLSFLNQVPQESENSKDISLSSSLQDKDVGFDCGFPDQDQFGGNRLSPRLGWSSFEEEGLSPSHDQSYNSLLQSYNKDSGTYERTVSSTPDFVEIMCTATMDSKTMKTSPTPSTEAEDYEVISNTYALNLKNEEDLQSLRHICREKGLDCQDYKCRSCGSSIGMIYGSTRYCHFSGYHYCLECHDNDEFIIPSKIIHNWDFKKYPISKSSKLFLEQMENEPILDLKALNPLIYSFVPEMATIEQHRTQLGFLRSYLFTCRQSVAEELRKKIWPREHLYEHFHLFSFTDLLQVPSGFLNQMLQKVISFGLSHISSCNLCSQKGFICEVCNNPKVIYPFEIFSTYRCTKCLAVFHKDCMDSNKSCPKCERQVKRKQFQDIVYSD